MGRLVKIGFSCNTLAVRPGSRLVHPPRHDKPYVWSRDRMSTLTSFGENFICSSLFAYSLTSKAITDSLRPPNSD